LALCLQVVKRLGWLFLVQSYRLPSGSVILIWRMVLFLHGLDTETGLGTQEE
jgi:hypothetical protein